MENTPNIIGNCRIISKLGQGGMGAVYKAEHTTLGRVVALKLLPQEFSQSKESVQRFLREARAAAQLEHPNVVPIFDAGSQSGQYYITMELVNGSSLAALLQKKGRLGEQEALGYMLQAAHGLVAAHEAGLIHRDIKPDNLLLSEEGVIKIADFGLVSDVAKDSGLTQSGAMLGTPNYMSPEQCNGQKADARSDLYSLGATFFRLLTGEAPYKAPTPIAVLYKHLHEPTPDPRIRNPQLSSWVSDLLLRLMAKRPEDRLQSAATLVELLGSTQQGLEPTLRAEDTPTLSPAAGLPAVVPPSLTPPSGMPAVQQGQTTTAVTPIPQSSVMQVSGDSAVQVARPNKALRWVAALMVLALLGAGGFFGFQKYHDVMVDEAKREAGDLVSLHKYPEAIGLLEQTFVTYPERQDLKALRDSYEVAFVRRQVEQMKQRARGQSDLRKYEAAVAEYAKAIALIAQYKTLPGLEPDPSLAELKGQAERLRDFHQNMKAGREAEDAGNFEAAVAAYKKASTLETAPGTEAREAEVRAHFGGLMAEARQLEQDGKFIEALNCITRAAALDFRNVSGHQQRVEERIKFEQLLLDAEALSGSGKFRDSALALLKAEGLAPDVSLAAQLRKRAADLTRDADFQDAVAQGERALVKKDWAGALAFFKKAGQIKPEEDLTSRRIKQAQAGQLVADGQTAFSKGDWKTAEAQWNKARALTPKDPLIQRRLNELNSSRAAIARLKEEARNARANLEWDKAINVYQDLAKLDAREQSKYERLAGVVRFDWGLAEARELAQGGKFQEARDRILKVKPYDPSGGTQVDDFVREMDRKQNEKNRIATSSRAAGDSHDLVRKGKVKAAILLLTNAVAGDPRNAELANLKVSLESVEAVEALYTRLMELQQDAQASAQVSSDQKDKKDIKAWLEEIKSWSGRLAKEKLAARNAWLEKSFDKIAPSRDTMKATARGMAQAFSALAAKFQGKAVDTAKSKISIGGFGGGGRRGGYGGFGAGGNIGGDSKRAAVYSATAQALVRSAAQARRIGASQ